MGLEMLEQDLPMLNLVFIYSLSLPVLRVYPHG